MFNFNINHPWPMGHKPVLIWLDAPYRELGHLKVLGMCVTVLYSWPEKPHEWFLLSGNLQSVTELHRQTQEETYRNNM